MPDDVIDISAGWAHACALTASGDVWCWGENTSLQIGVDVSGVGVSPTLVPLPGCAVRLWAGGFTTCAKMQSGEVLCWGAEPGTLWDGHLPTAIAEIRDAEHVSLGYHACAVLADHALWCWGSNAWGQLGLGYVSVVEPPQPTGFMATDVTVGSGHTCARGTDDIVYCWGMDGWGALGDGVDRFRASPANVADVGSVVDIEAGPQTVCSLSDDGRVRCWGRDVRTLRPVTRPTQLEGLPDALGIDTGRVHSCAVTTDGAWCWGINDSRLLGGGEPSDRGPLPTTTPGVVTEVAVGSSHSCTLNNDGTARCWGRGDMGQLGNGMLSMIHAPGTLVLLDGPIIGIDASEKTTCAVVSGGAAYCFGMNLVGQLGIGFASTDPFPVPVRVRNADATIQISVGHGQTVCAIDGVSGLQCWGLGAHGELGDGTASNRAEPAGVAGIVGTVRNVDVGAAHACAVTDAGRVWCWGDNVGGQIGDGTFSTAWRPVMVPSITDAVEVVAGELATCVRHADGAVSCWGADEYGELGQGGDLIVASPQRVAGE